MKKIYLAVALLCSSLWVASQDIEKMSPKNQKEKNHFSENQNLANKNPEVFSGNSTVSYGTVIGQTSFDLQSNYGTGSSKIQRYDDGRIAAVWMQSLDLNGGNPDRGTGYNIYDPITQAWDTGAPYWFGINTVRTGWPQILNFNSKEYTIQHDFSVSDIIVNSRDTVGQGWWGISQGYTFDAVWPRAVNTGDTIHMIAIDNQGIAHNGINNPLKYFRSDDAGLSWSIISYSDFPGYDNNTFWFSEISADAYVIDAYQNYVSIAIGGGWDPLVLYKSDNYGEDGSWTKTVIYKPDTSYSYVDSMSLRHVIPSLSSELSIVIDKNGITHLSTTGLSINWYFGEDKPQNSNGQRQYNPLSSLGIYYWNENMGSIDHVYNEFISTDPASGNVLFPVSYFDDYTGEGNYDIPSSSNNIGTYNSGLAGHTNIALDQDSGIFMVWSQVAETSEQLLPENYRDLYFVYSFDNGSNWSDPVNLASLEIPDDGFSGGTLAEEEVFPSTIKRVGNDDKLHMIFQTDAQAGMHVAGNMHPIALSSIVYYPIDIQYFRNISALNSSNSLSKKVEVYPNPSSDIVNIKLNDAREHISGSVRVFNLNGHEIRINQALIKDDKSMEIDISNLEMGIYLLKIPIGNKFYTQKIIKQ